jgi:hypothetical protein
MVWLNVWGLCTLNFVVCFLFALNVKLVVLWTPSYFFVLWSVFHYEWLRWACFGLLPAIWFQSQLLLLAPLMLAAYAIRRPPFDVFSEVFFLVSRSSLFVFCLVALYSSVTKEHDLVVAPLVIGAVLFSVAWAMFTHYEKSRVTYVFFFFAWVHLLQLMAMCFDVPNAVLWGAPALAYLVVSSGLLVLIGMQLSAERFVGEREEVIKSKSRV